MSTEKDLNYWKANAEEDYKQVPISVLRYISELETAVKNCSIPDVSQRYTIEDIERCVENWGLCKVEKEYIKRFLNGG